MASKSSPHQSILIVKLLLILAAIALIAISNFILILEIHHRMDRLENSVTLNDQPETFKLPVAFITQEPECTNRLLDEMGIKSVRIRSGLINHSSP